MYSAYSAQIDETETAGLLTHLSIPELQQLCEDDDRLNSLVMDMQQVKKTSVKS